MIKRLYNLLTITFLSQFASALFGQGPPRLNNVQINNQNQAEWILNRLEYFDTTEEVDSLNYYILKGRTLCKALDSLKIKDARLIGMGGDICTFIANNLVKKNQLSEALFTYNKAQNLYTINENKSKIALCYNRIGDIYHTLNNQIDALNNYHKAISIYKQLKDSTQTVLTYINIAKAYKSQEKLHKAQETLLQALNLVKSNEDPYVLSHIKNSIAQIKIEMGDIEEALSILQEALSLSKKSKNNQLIAPILNNIGEVYLNNNESTKAKDFYRRALNFASDNKYYIQGAHSLNNLGKYYFYIKNYEKAIDFASRSLEIGEEMKAEKVQINAIHLLLNIYEKQNNWKKAFYYQKLLIQRTEKRKKSTVEQILLQEKVRLDKEKMRFLEKKKEVENSLVVEKQNQHQNILYIVGGLLFIVMIAVLFVIYFRLRASREKNKYITKQSEERKLLLQEVHHRVKNNFQIVSSMLRLQSYRFEGEELQSSFNEAVSRINAMAIVHEVIYQQEEFRDISVKLYLKKLIKILQKTGHYKVLIQVESEEFPLKIETLISLGIILNELITNSYKHAFDDSIDNPTIKITLKCTGEKAYELKYMDNGVGISKELSTNFGMDLIDTIISNYDGTMEIHHNLKWATIIKIDFSEY